MPNPPVKITMFILWKSHLKIWLNPFTVYKIFTISETIFHNSSFNDIITECSKKIVPELLIFKKLLCGYVPGFSLIEGRVCYQ